MRVFLAGEGYVLSLFRRKNMRLHLAGNPSPMARLRLSLLAGHPYRLISYFYVRDNPGADDILRVLADAPDHLIMDSGLFSFMFGAEQGKMPNTYGAYRDYTRRYLDCVDQWGYDGIVVESDVHNLLGMDAVYRLREEFAPLGDRVMYVWHRPEGLEGLEALARKHSYIALSIPEMRQISSGTVGKKIKHMSGATPTRVISMVHNLLGRAHNACGGAPPRIHLLGCTVTDLMETNLAWSCDSTSWLASVMWGKAHIFQPGGKIEEVSIRSERFQKYRDAACRHHPEVVEFAATQKNSDYLLNCFGSAFAFAQYQHWLDSRYQNVPARGGELPGGSL